MRRIAVPLALLAAAVLAPVADAAPRLGRVALRASSPVAAELDLPAGTTPGGFRVTTRGTYAALVVSNVRTGDVHEFALLVPGFERGALLSRAQPKPLPAGRYRVALLTDGPAEASLALGPSPVTRLLTATRPVVASADAGALSPVGEVRAGFAATGRESVLFAFRTASDVAAVDYAEICTAAAGGSCAGAAENYFAVGPGADSGAKSTMYGMVRPAGLPQGVRHDFLEQYAGAGTTAYGFAVVATL